MNPRILIYSNNCFSDTDSNGRTLKKFFQNYDKKYLAQFYVQNAYPDYEACANYFRVTDKQALKALTGQKPNGEVTEEQCEEKGKGVKTKKNALSMLIRNAVWNTGLWKSKDYIQWVKKFDPQVVLVQSGDCAFIYKIALRTAKKFGIPIVIYNSENYYFKKYDYFRAKGFAHYLYPIFHKKYRNAFRKIEKIAAYNIYNSEELENEYKKVFNNKAVALYTGTAVKKRESYNCSKNFSVCYLGNIGVGRDKPLLEIAETLNDNLNGCKLNVYGKIYDSVSEKFIDNPLINYHGIVSYEEVVKIMKNSDLIVHAENFDDYYQEDLKFAFSTKIADSLACGTPFLVYAPSNMTCSKYLIRNDAAFVVGNKKELEKTIQGFVNNTIDLTQHLQNALNLALQNHDSNKNSEKLQNILREVVEKSE